MVTVFLVYGASVELFRIIIGGKMIIGIGIDAVELERFRESLERYGERIKNRLFTKHEQEYCDRFSSPLEHYAVRFAAKEAFMKAIGTGKTNQVYWCDVEIVNEPSGKPILAIKGAAAGITAGLGASRLHVSLSHSRTIAAAVVVIENET